MLVLLVHFGEFDITCEKASVPFTEGIFLTDIGSLNIQNQWRVKTRLTQLPINRSGSRQTKLGCEVMLILCLQNDQSQSSLYLTRRCFSHLAAAINVAAGSGNTSKPFASAPGGLLRTAGCPMQAYSLGPPSDSICHSGGDANAAVSF